MINDIDANKRVISNKFAFGKQGFKYLIDFKDSEKIRLLRIFRPQMIVHKINIDENRRIYFLIKEEKVFFEYMEILSKLAISLKTNLVGNLYVLKIYKTEKIDTKGGFQCLYALIILIDSIYRKDEN